ncbi:hypothetical protein [Streptomyces misionensis]|uniref:hypothetical protein n=1 Tax=Streptomyces misionensis TaxID=67331 RepID=UPI0037DA58C6
MNFLTPQPAAGEPAAVGDEQQVLGRAVQGRTGAEGPVEVVGAQPDPGEVGAEEPEGPRIDGGEEDPQPLLGNPPVQAEGDGDVQPVDDVVAEGRGTATGGVQG